MPLLKSFAVTLILVFAAGTASAQAPNGRPGNRALAEVPKNVILMIADGAGPATFTMVRDYERALGGASDGSEGSERLALDDIKVGTIQTYSEDSRVTDSAAGATAFSTGHKTNNGFIAVDPEGRPLATLLEAAQRKGMATGMVVTSRITHATPASFAAHVDDRWKENEIARQLLSHEIDVLIGGGRRHFLTEEEGGRRKDGRNLLSEAEEAGYTVVTRPEALYEVDALPVLGLLADSHLPYALDLQGGRRTSTQGPPRALDRMMTKALQLLKESEKGRENGIFLVVEGSRIDHAGHSNDAAAHLREALAYDRAVARARAFAERDGETLLLSTADHETGGLSLGRDVDGEGVYAWKPSVLEDVKASQGTMIRQILDQGNSPAQVLEEEAGIGDLTPAERDRLNRAAEEERYEALSSVISDIIGKRALVGWSSHGHTAVDVGLYGYGPGAERFIGHHDNTYLGKELARLLRFDLETLTAELREKRAEEGTRATTTGEK